ncbi:MAG: hypothetical protein KKF46_08525 [Nanoarchaeota archaeon]|nr:hypothetical protein [Nanoarchaeota archaeon]MBU1322374.1 hypothetical protein [Nanoarchaeota archaeon]MBU1598401.1 hypothetical protein [Nanoarchaeota archaeon]MBU2440778.1 hypothetical protein [Nanoarchaeota archaeon]
MKKIKFEVLGIETEISHFDHYFDDGFQDDLVDYAEKLADKYHKPCINFKSITGASGICFYDDSLFPSRRRVHIAYKKGRDYFHNISTRAHEETHALILLSNIELLENEIFKQYDRKFSFRWLGHESKAEIGSLYALSRIFKFEEPISDSFLSQCAPSIKKRKIQQAHDIFFS